jgi:response regulator NasT
MASRDVVQRKRVVIVDDNADVRRLVREQLDLGGFAVVGEAGDGDEAIRVVERLRPHLVVLDLEMGRMSGVTPARHPGRDAQVCRRCVLVVS